MSDFSPSRRSQTPESQARRVASAISLHPKSRISIAELEAHCEDVAVENLVRTNWDLLKAELALVAFPNASYLEEEGTIYIYPNGVSTTKRVTRTMKNIFKS